MDKKVVDKLVTDLRPVSEAFARSGRLNDFIGFFDLVAKNKFNLNSISCQLFFDVIKFLNTKDICTMRFTEEV